MIIAVCAVMSKNLSVITAERARWMGLTLNTDRDHLMKNNLGRYCDFENDNTQQLTPINNNHPEQSNKRERKRGG